jgi:hypothetical protein
MSAGLEAQIEFNFRGGPKALGNTTEFDRPAFRTVRTVDEAESERFTAWLSVKRRSERQSNLWMSGGPDRDRSATLACSVDVTSQAAFALTILDRVPLQYIPIMLCWRRLGLGRFCQ